MKAKFKTNNIIFLMILPICLNAQIVIDKMKAKFKTNNIIFLMILPICLNAQIVIDKSFSTFHLRTDMTHEKSVFEAGNWVELNSGFEVQLGGTFEININECGEK